MRKEDILSVCRNLEREGNHAAAIQYLEKSIDLFPNRSSLYYYLGDLYAIIGDTAKSREMHRLSGTWGKKQNESRQQSIRNVLHLGLFLLLPLLLAGYISLFLTDFFDLYFQYNPDFRPGFYQPLVTTESSPPELHSPAESLVYREFGKVGTEVLRTMIEDEYYFLNMPRYSVLDAEELNVISDFILEEQLIEEMTDEERLVSVLGEQGRRILKAYDWLLTTREIALAAGTDESTVRRAIAILERWKVEPDEFAGLTDPVQDSLEILLRGLSEDEISVQTFWGSPPKEPLYRDYPFQDYVVYNVDEFRKRQKEGISSYLGNPDYSYDAEFQELVFDRYPNQYFKNYDSHRNLFRLLQQQNLVSRQEKEEYCAKLRDELDQIPPTQRLLRYRFLLELARVKYDQNQYSEAIRYLEESLTESRNLPDLYRVDAHYLLGAIFYEQQRYPEARAHTEKIRQDRTFIDGLILTFLTDLATDAYEDPARLMSLDLDCIRLLNTLQQDPDYLNLLLEELEKLRMRRRDDPIFHFLQALLYYTMDHYERCVESATQYINLEKRPGFGRFRNETRELIRNLPERFQ